MAAPSPSPLILAALDASPRAPAVLDAAIRLARAEGARLLVYRATGLPTELPDEAYRVKPDAVIDLLRSKAQSELEVLTGRVPPELLAGVEVAVAAPWRGIVDAATRHHATGIVIGSHGYDAIDHLLGTTAAKVVNHATCSVLVVR